MTPLEPIFTEDSSTSRRRGLSRRVSLQRGFSIVIVTAVLGLAVTLGFVLSSIVVSDLRSSTTSLDSAQALAAAEAGIELALGWLRGLTSPPNDLSPITFAENLQVGAALVNVGIIPSQQNQMTYLKRFTIQSSASVRDAVRTVQVRVRLASFGEFLYCTNDEGQGIIWYYTGDVLDGPLFTNDRLAIWGRPTFLGPVYSAAPTILKGGAYNPDFRAGYRLGVPRIVLPTMQDIMSTYQQYGSGSPFTIYAKPNRPVRITFRVQNGTGLMHYVGYDASGHPINGWVPVDEISDGMVLVKGDVRVKGTLKGAVTIFAQVGNSISGGNIYVDDDILYSCSDARGRPLEGCQDRLGLVSERNVIVADNGQNRNDCIIDAAILALGTSFTVQNYYRGNPRGKLIVWGSITQNVRGPVGTFSRWGRRTGYLKEYHYDPRLSQDPPPFFPKAGMYVVEAWRELSSD